MFVWPAFWWLEHYIGFRDYVRTRFPCLLANERVVAFDLTEQHQSSAIRQAQPSRRKANRAGERRGMIPLVSQSIKHYDFVDGVSDVLMGGHGAAKRHLSIRTYGSQTSDEAGNLGDTLCQELL